MILRWLKLQKPIAHAEKALEYVEKTLAILRQRASVNPEHGAYPRLIPQVEYVRTALIEPNTDRTKLHTLSLGGGAASETLEREAPELFEALGGVIYIADQIDDGLEIELQELEDSLKVLALFASKTCRTFL